MGVAMASVVKVGVGYSIAEEAVEQCTPLACKQMNCNDPSNTYRWYWEHGFGSGLGARGWCVRNNREPYCGEGEVHVECN